MFLFKRFNKVLVLVFILLIIISCKNPFEKTSLQIISYNVQNLFDDIDNGSEYKNYDPGRSNWDSQKFNKKMENISKVLKAISSDGPDIIALQEVENKNVLEILRKKYLFGMGYKYSYVTSFPGSAINLGIISKIRASNIKVHNLTYRNKLSRGIQEIKFKINNEDFIIFNNHWKSKSGGAKKTEKLRIEYAKLLKSRIKELKTKNIIILGDLNENHNEYEKVSEKYSTALVPYYLKNRDPFFDSFILGDSKNINGNIFFSPWFESSFKGSYKYKNKWESIDHFVLASGFFDNKGFEYKAFEVFKDDFLMNKKREPKRWMTYKMSGYSDHLPIILNLEFMSENNAP